MLIPLADEASRGDSKKLDWLGKKSCIAPWGAGEGLGSNRSPLLNIKYDDQACLRRDRSQAKYLYLSTECAQIQSHPCLRLRLPLHANKPVFDSGHASTSSAGFKLRDIPRRRLNRTSRAVDLSSHQLCTMGWCTSMSKWDCAQAQSLKTCWETMSLKQGPVPAKKAPGKSN